MFPFKRKPLLILSLSCHILLLKPQAMKLVMLEKAIRTILPVMEHTSRDPRIHVASPGYNSETMHCWILRHAGTHFKLTTCKLHSMEVYCAAGIMSSGVEKHHNTHLARHYVRSGSLLVTENHTQFAIYNCTNKLSTMCMCFSPPWPIYDTMRMLKQGRTKIKVLHRHWGH